MTTVGYSDMTLKTATRKSSPKISQIKDMPKACISIWKGRSVEEAMTKPYVIMDTDVEILEDEKSKEEFWRKEFGEVFSGPNDPDYVVLRFKPYCIEYFVGDKMEKWASCSVKQEEL
jgi:general stress protein 26